MNPLFENHPELSRYTDEVKLIGHIQINNDDPDHPYNYVEWDVPKEKLKIGGYILLMELPKDHSYVTNLDMVNPLGEDGELLKEVHIKRDENVYRLITIQNLD